MNRNLTILICGSKGVIGSFLTAHLSGRANIYVLDKRGEDAFNHYLVDLTDINDVINFVTNSPKFDIIVFFTGLAHQKGGKGDYNKYKQVNYSTLQNLLSSLANADKLPDKLIFSSTISVYGERSNVTIYDEKVELIPYSPYAITKMEAENYLTSQFPGKIWSLRFAPVYSSNFRLNIDRRTKIGPFLYRVGDGENRLSLLNIINIGVVIDKIIENQLPEGTYNLSDEINYSYNYILKFCNGSRLLTIPRIFIVLIFFGGRILNNNSLKENSLKLLKDNIFPSDKIRQYINLPYRINDI